MTDGNEHDLDTYKIFMGAIDERIELIKAKYANTTAITTLKVDNPVKQQSDSNELRTCLVAAAINAMKAFGTSDVPSEEELLAELIEIESPTETGELRVAILFEYLERKGIAAINVWGYPEKLVDGLLGGDCALQTIPSRSVRSRLHATLFAGVKINNGNVSFVEHDPDTNEPEVKECTLTEHVNRLYQPDVLTGLWLLTHKQ